MRGHVVGILVGLDERGPVINYPDNPHGPLAAESTLPRSSLSVPAAPGQERRVLLVFEHERSDRPVVVGLVETLDEGGSAGKGNDAARAPRAEVVVDGRRVVLDATDEIVLRCGEASITLRRNGRVVIRGAYVETRSRGVNRVKGGSVEIN
jgi:hypothetical protein